jgi:prolyl-tRNA synthetase
MDQDQKRKPVIMGCYGIGVSRTMAACVEMSCDDWGIRWPMPIAPYHVLITVLKPDADLLTQANQIAQRLADNGFDVLIDDRDERPGGKFKDADLIGIPVRYTLSEKSIEAGGVEFKLRTDSGKGEVMAVDDAIARTMAAAEA